MKFLGLLLTTLIVLSGCGGDDSANSSASNPTEERKEMVALLAKMAKKKCLQEIQLTDAQKQKLGENFQKDVCDCTHSATMKQEAYFIEHENIDEKSFKKELLACISEVTNIPLAVMQAAGVMLNLKAPKKKD